MTVVKENKFTVLAALDLNPGSALVLDRALAMAGVASGGEVHVVTVAEPRAPISAYPGMISPPGVDGVEAEHVAAYCRKRIDELLKANPALPMPHVHVHTAVGLPADEIVWLAANLDADAIVIATHGRRGLRRLLIGSVAEKVVRLAGCPVVVVREKNHNPEWKVPEIEPLCPECATKRFETQGKELWCERHASFHIKHHVYSYSAAGDPNPRAWDSTTGSA